MADQFLILISSSESIVVVAASPSVIFYKKLINLLNQVRLPYRKYEAC